MRKATALCILAAAALCAAWAPAAAVPPILPEPVARYSGHAYYDLTTGIVQWETAPVIDAAFDVYSNIHAPPVFGFTSPDFSAEFGDRVTTTGPGILDEQDFTVYNSSASFGEMFTCKVQLNFKNAVTNAPLGSYVTNDISFGSGLFPGYFAIITVTGLGALNINLNTTDILATQSVVDPVGYMTRLGIICQDPPELGSSLNTMYINASTVGPPGYYTIGVPPLNANVGYRIATLAPVPADAVTWGRVRSDYR